MSTDGSRAAIAPNKTPRALSEPARGRGRRSRRRQPSPDAEAEVREAIAPGGRCSHANDIPVGEILAAASRASPAAICAILMLHQAFCEAPGFLARGMERSVVSIVHVPGQEWGPPIVEAWNLIIDLALRRGPPGSTGGDQHVPAGNSYARDGTCPTGAPIRPVLVQAFARSPKSDENVLLLQDALRASKPVLVVARQPELLAADILVVEEQRLVVVAPGAEILTRLSRALHPPGPPPTLDPAHALQAETVSALLPLHVDAAWRENQDAVSYLERLRELLDRHARRTSRAVVRAAPTLETLPGMGAAGAWGRRMASDMKAYARGELPWSELDRGAVLEGPPGTGKSTFARALAGSAGVPLIAASMAEWQGSRSGHLGDLLNAMQATFAKARGSAPCVLLIDEIDSFPARAAIRHDHRDYVVAVVNGLLEQLDGAVDRDGVVVIGTCNEASGLDPALLRPGRLERVIHMSRPDAPGMEEILRVHLGDALRDADLSPVATAAAARRAVGADVEAWCREARRRARELDRPMRLDDLADQVGPPPPDHAPETLRRMAVHEAGHALAYGRMGCGILKQVVVSPKVGVIPSNLLDVAAQQRLMPYMTREQALERIRAALAGRAAEEVLLGVPSSGAGGSDLSDLARATAMACRLVSSLGLDDHEDTLLYMGAADDAAHRETLLLMPDMRRRVGHVVRLAYSEAMSLIRADRAVVEVLANRLVERGSLPGTEVEDLLARPVTQRVAP